MDKKSRFLLQKIDCNCNDCKFMVRNIDRFKESLIWHEKISKDEFSRIKNNLISRALYWKNKGELQKYESIMKEVIKLRFVFDKKTVSINYGYCSNLSKEVSFIPNTCQLDTQSCFKHRKD